MAYWLADPGGRWGAGAEAKPLANGRLFNYILFHANLSVNRRARYLHSMGFK
jgi:hypothetical protein